MIIRIIAAGAAALVLSATTATGQGKTTEPIVLSKAAIGAMAHNKPKTKTPLTARVGMSRSSIHASGGTKPAPTSVVALKPQAKAK